MTACVVQTAAVRTSWTLLGTMSAAAAPSRKSQAMGIWAGEQAHRSKRHTASKYDFIKVKCVHMMVCSDKRCSFRASQVQGLSDWPCCLEPGVGQSVEGSQ